jgi:hypothetical protein
MHFLLPLLDPPEHFSSLYSAHLFPHVDYPQSSITRHFEIVSMLIVKENLPPQVVFRVLRVRRVSVGVYVLSRDFPAVIVLVYISCISE